ncbi:hypothetical protein Bca4012_093159 [Brassica carinata]|uniref:Uncharacterized protein n=1 Tax=Brassica carinata TaxID=52824 RepID=A0A8X7TXW5_BRACI|nr:hypothetical protein Bca52824_075380 [Brassica carinata]
MDTNNVHHPNHYHNISSRDHFKSRHKHRRNPRPEVYPQEDRIREVGFGTSKRWRISSMIR